MLIQQERLRVSEEEKGRLVEDIARLKIESTRWEEALDRLQVRSTDLSALNFELQGSFCQCTTASHLIFNGTVAPKQSSPLT